MVVVCVLSESKDSAIITELPHKGFCLFNNFIIRKLLVITAGHKNK